MQQEHQQKDKKNSSTWNIKPYLAMGLTAFIVIACSVAFFFFVYRYQGASELVALIISVLQPIVIGVAIAYILNPIMNLYQGLLIKHTKLSKKWRKGISVTAAMLTGVLLLTIFFWMVAPKVYASIEELVVGMPRNIRVTVAWMKDFWESNPQFSEYFGGALTKVAIYVEDFLESQLLPQTHLLVAQITTGIFATAKMVMNIVVGIIVSIYVLIEKEHFIAIGKKVIYGLFDAKPANVIVTTIRKAHSIFSGFIVGKIVDSLIIGILTFIVLSIVDMPYTALVSVIVGVTNVIPFFGPYFGAIPSFLLILLQDPVKALWFLVIILIIQQLDGNVIGPKILGNSTGLSSFWVVTAILLFGGLFGVMGMIIGVPTFALLYYIVNEIVKHFLRKKGLPEESEDYLTVEKRDIESGELIYYNQNNEEHLEEIKEEVPKETEN